MNKLSVGIFLEDSIKLLFSSPENESYKFGYYNYSPLSRDGSKILGHKIFFEGRAVEKEDRVEIGYFTVSDNKWHKLAESNAFNWQQGSMLQWLGPDYNSKVIFNDSNGEKYIARIIDVTTLEEKVIPKAIYAVTPDGKTSISMHFERCNFTRAYSYASVKDETWNEKTPEKDGIIKIDLATGNHETIIPLRAIIADMESIDEAHWFEHIMLNPSGSRFAFYHRYGSITGFTTRSFTADTNGRDIWSHPNAQTERVTHLGWKNDKEYALYTIPQSKLNQAMAGNPNEKKKAKWYVAMYRMFLKPFVPRKLVKTLPKPKSFYALTEDRNGVIVKYNPHPGSMDGHPGFTGDGRYMLTDTYADKDGFRNLLMYDTKTDVSHMLGRFYSVYNNCGWRTDLHPRFSPDETKVIIDSNHNGKNSIMMFGINWEMIKGSTK